MFKDSTHDLEISLCAIISKFQNEKTEVHKQAQLEQTNAQCFCKSMVNYIWLKETLSTVASRVIVKIITPIQEEKPHKSENVVKKRLQFVGKFCLLKIIKTNNKIPTHHHH